MPYAVDRVAASAPEASSRTTRPGTRPVASWPGAGDASGPREYAGTRITRAGRVRYEHDAQGRVILRQRSRPSRKPETWRYG
nr:hypothetical protein [Streptomyces sp. HB202]